jgi:hypothetical protein
MATPDIVDRADDAGISLTNNAVVRNFFWDVNKPWNSTDNIINLATAPLTLTGVGSLAKVGGSFALKRIGGYFAKAAAKPTIRAAGQTIGKGTAEQGIKISVAQAGKEAGEEAAKQAAKEAAEQTAKTAAKMTPKTHKELFKEGLNAARETRSASKGWVFGRPTADASTMAGAAKNAMAKAAAETGQEVSEATMAGMAARAAAKAGKGSPILGFAAKHPVTTVLGTGAVAAGSGAVYTAYSALQSLDNATGGLLSSLWHGTGGTASTLMSGASTLLNGGTSKLGTIFNWASDNLEFMGMDPQWAKFAVGLGSFMLINKMLNFTADRTGLNQILPYSGLVMAIGAVVLAFQIADAAAEAKAQPHGPETQREIQQKAPAPLAPAPLAPAPAMQ